jgi:predicted alpha/beta-hydrolase family hydrolase
VSEAITREIDTPQGLARVHIAAVAQARAALVLGHGAGGGVGAPDLVAAARAAREQEMTVVLVEQPYRVAGRRSPPPAARLDEAWLAVLADLHELDLGGLALIVGGRSSGARVACRTAAAAGAQAVLCLAFPLHPPGRAADVSASRLPELDGVAVPTLVVQGAGDPFGMPPAAPDRVVVTVPGTHALRNGAAVAAAVGEWLAARLAQ